MLIKQVLQLVLYGQILQDKKNNNDLKDIGKSNLSWYVENGWLPEIPDVGEVPANLEDCSWTTIQKLINSDTFKNYYKIGDTKSVTLSNGEKLVMRVESINDGDGDSGFYYPKGTVDFISTTCMNNTIKANNSNSSISWDSTNLRLYCNNDIYSLLPSQLQNSIVEKTHNYYNNNYESFIEASDKIWIPTVFELFGPGAYTYDEGGSYNKHYALYDSSSSRIKKLGLSGQNANNYWTSSRRSDAGRFGMVTTTGTLSDSLFASNLGLVIGFRIG